MVSLPHASAEELHLDAAVTKGWNITNHLLLFSFFWFKHLNCFSIFIVNTIIAFRRLKFRRFANATIRHTVARFWIIRIHIVFEKFIWFAFCCITMSKYNRFNILSRLRKNQSRMLFAFTITIYRLSLSLKIMCSIPLSSGFFLFMCNYYPS